MIPVSQRERLPTAGGRQNRIRFQSTSKRSRQASANVYRPVRRRLITSNSVAQEERVHNAASSSGRNDRVQDDGAVATLRPSPERFGDKVARSEVNTSGDVVATDLDTTTVGKRFQSCAFADELDVVLDRNPSEVFVQFHRQVWPLVRSLPELLHHATQVVDLILSSLLTKQPITQKKDDDASVEKAQEAQNQVSESSADEFYYIPNLATNDLLHLLAVLARDLRQEIHPYLHTHILPRIVNDLLRPSPIPAGIPVPPETVETAFRTMAYIFKYDAARLLAEVKESNDNGAKDPLPCLELLRQYYGGTLAHRNPLVRRLAGEAFAPLIRRLPTDKAQSKHLKRVIRSLVAGAARENPPPQLYSPQQPSKFTASLTRRLQLDAADGIAGLLWEVARGVKGQFHSRGERVVLSSVLDCIQAGARRDIAQFRLVAEVTTGFVARALENLEAKPAAQMMQSFVNAALNSANSIQSWRCDGGGDDGLTCLVQALQQGAAFRQGHLLQTRQNLVTDISLLLTSLLDLETFPRLSSDCQVASIKLLCFVWGVVQDSREFADSMCRQLAQLLHPKNETKNDSLSPSEAQTVTSLAGVLTRELLTRLPVKCALSQVGSLLISAASLLTTCTSSLDDAILLMQSMILSTRAFQPRDQDSDCFYDHSFARHCSVSDLDRNRLLKCWMVECELGEGVSLDHLANAVPCLTFVTLAKPQDPSSCSDKVMKWLLRLAESILACDGYYGTDERAAKFSVLLSIILESMASLLDTAGKDESGGTVHNRQLMRRFRHAAEKHVVVKSNSHWAVRSVAAAVRVLSEAGLQLEMDSNKVFELLVPNLSRSSHFLRLHSLSILASLPERPFVTDHSDIDLTDDLDEDPSTGPLSSERRAGSIGMSNVPMILLKIESITPSLAEERIMTSQIGLLEVLGKSGRLPVVHAEAAVSHLVGVLHCKFAPLWPAAIRAIASIAAAHEEAAWSILYEALNFLVDVDGRQLDASSALSESNRLDSVSHLDARVAWDMKQDPGLFSDDLKKAKDVGRVSRHECTDAVTVFESCWAAIEKAPRIMLAHSKRFVELFLRFIHQQHLRGEVDDPDARELLPHIDTVAWENEGRLSAHPKWAVQRRLRCMLKAFAATKAPQQLYQSRVLRYVFASLLGNSDDSISQLAFRCTMRFKDSCLAPYSHCIEKLFEKGKLRESLLQLKTVSESGDIASEHRKKLIPNLARILFGRLSAKAVVKSSKDSPSARRSIVLEFANSFCVNESELFPFIYLTIRAYIPTRFSIELVDDDHDEGFHDKMIEEVIHLSPDDVIHFPPARHQGFLNMLEAVLDQLGHRVTKYLRAFIAVILGIARAYSVKSQDEGELTGIGESEDFKSFAVRSSTIRALCFRRMAGIFQRFQDMIDVSSFSDDLWELFRGSIQHLPEMACNSDHAPAMLHCLVALSAHRDLAAFLEAHDEVTPQVIKCLSAKRSKSVVDLVLTFVENLLGTSDEASGTAPHLIRRYARCLLVEFYSRLETSSVVLEGRYGRGAPKSAGRKTCRRELAILLRLSKCLEQDRHSSDKEESEVFEALCRVLLPFLGKWSVTSTDHLSVLEILNSIIPRVTEPFAADYYASLSHLFGQGERGRPRPHSKEVLRAISSLLVRLTRTVFLKAVRCAAVAADLCALHSSRVDELDYDKVLSALNQLSEKESWTSFSTNGSEVDPTLTIPLVQLCFHYLHDSDGVIVRSAFSSLMVLVSVAADALVLEDGQNSSSWTKFFQGSVISCVRDGLHGRDHSIRRFYVLIMRQVAISCRGSSSPHLYGDLAALASEQDPDADFFSNITHLQVHRRARALQRLRKTLLSSECTESHFAAFSMHSLSNVLLPIALHPIYECKSTTEESLALEAIATVGAIARNLSWNKYNTLLHGTLNQFHRHVEQERFVVGLLCAIIDAFHFEMNAGIPPHSDVAAETSAVVRGMETRLIPKVEKLLVKEMVDKHGNKVEVLRPSIILALLKLFLKLPANQFRLKVPRLLTVVCGALRSRESDARDAARTTLAKMASAMDVIYLPDVIRELALSLTEGYQLHVRSAAIHSILLELSESGRSIESPRASNEGRFIDLALPGLMDLLQQDLFGEAQERLDANGSHVRYVKEAGGSKSYHSLELMAQLICFKPIDSTSPLYPGSSVHILVSPFIERLRDPKIGSNLIRKIRECLSRIVRGFSGNPSACADSIFPIAYGTLAPFIQQPEIAQVCNDGSYDSDGDGTATDSQKPIFVSGGVPGRQLTQDLSRGEHRVAEWIPSMLSANQSADQALKGKRRTMQELSRVRDGQNAPKLTGSNRLKPVAVDTFSLNCASNSSAVMFGLQVFHAGLKRFKELSDDDCKRHLDPFVPLLATCVCVAKDLDIVALALKCASVLLRLDLPSLSRCTGSLASKCLEFLTSSGSSSNQYQEILHASFKMLSTLLDKRDSTPLTSEQMQVLTSYLQSSLLDSDQHAATVSVIKSIVARKLVSPELYDLMEKLLKQTVRGMKPSLRQQSSVVFVSYLLEYPLAPERLEQHLKDVVLNVKYEYPEGRLAALTVISTLLDRLPLPVVAQHAQLFFLPLTLQLVSDDSEECREVISRTMCQLVSKLPYDHQASLCDYVVRWSDDAGDLKRTGIQLYGLMVDSCPETLHRRSLGPRLAGAAQSALLVGAASGWELPYFALVLVEKTLERLNLAASFRGRPDLWDLVIQSLFSHHPWIRLVSSRIAVKQLVAADLGDALAVLETGSPPASTPPPLVEALVERPGALFDLARGFCHVIGLGENEQDRAATDWAIRGLTLILPVMQEFPLLCIAEDGSDALRGQAPIGEVDSENDGAEDTDPALPRRDPVAWVLTRLASAAKRKGSQRRQAVFKAFAALVSRSDTLVRPHLELLLEPLHRSDVETRNELEMDNLAHTKVKIVSDDKAAESQLAREVLQLVEETFHSSGAPETFVQAYAAVKSRAGARKERRKAEAKAAVVRSPQVAAQRRVLKQEREKLRRKRRVEEQRLGRGATAKRRHGL